jgi:RHS repeat-associated protein
VLDPSLDRSYDYDAAGRLWEAHSGNEARAHIAGQPLPPNPDGPYSQAYAYDRHGNMTQRVGWGGWLGAYVNQTQTFTGNRRDGFTYDASGTLTHDGSQTYTYDATGQQTFASQTGLEQAYDGDGRRGRATEYGETTHYLRSSALGGQVVAEIEDAAGEVWRGYVCAGWQTLAIQYAGSVSWVHADPVTKSQRLKTSLGGTSAIDLDPWGGETVRSGAASPPRKYTAYERDADGGDEAMFRRYEGRWQRFAQPDPFDGSYDLTDPQTFNRYSYVSNDPINFVDPEGLWGMPGEGDPVLYSMAQGAGLSPWLLRRSSFIFYGEYPYGDREFRGRGSWLVFDNPLGWGRGGGQTATRQSGLSPEERRQGFLDCIRDNEKWYNNIAHESASEFYDPRSWIFGASAIDGLWKARGAGGFRAAGKIVGRSIAGAIRFDLAARAGKFIGTGIGAVSGRNRLFKHCQKLWNVFNIPQPKINPNFTPR